MFVLVLGMDKWESQLERLMLDFMDGQYDVLVATTIIESGLDIPSANTIIINNADLGCPSCISSASRTAMYKLTHIYLFRRKILSNVAQGN